jgi:hypothetical protein
VAGRMRSIEKNPPHRDSCSIVPQPTTLPHRREVLYNILIEFGVPLKLVRLIKMCLKETFNEVRICKHLSDTVNWFVFTIECDSNMYLHEYPYMFRSKYDHP